MFGKICFLEEIFQISRSQERTLLLEHGLLEESFSIMSLKKSQDISSFKAILFL